MSAELIHGDARRVSDVLEAARRYQAAADRCATVRGGWHERHLANLHRQACADALLAAAKNLPRPGQASLFGGAA